MNTYWMTGPFDSKAELEKLGVQFGPLVSGGPCLVADWVGCTITPAVFDKIDHLFGEWIWGPEASNDTLPATHQSVGKLPAVSSEQGA